MVSTNTAAFIPCSQVPPMKLVLLSGIFFFNFPLIDVKRHKASMNDEVVISSITSMWTPWHNRHANNTAHYLEFAEPPRVQRTTASKGPKQSTPT